MSNHSRNGLFRVAYIRKRLPIAVFPSGIQKRFGFLQLIRIPNRCSTSSFTLSSWPAPFDFSSI